MVPRHGRGICGIIRHMEEIVPHQKLHNATSPKVSPANWLVLDETLKAEWEREASNAASEICRKKISVIIGLPGKNQAKAAYENNRNLYGSIIWSDEDGHEHGVEEILPFHGVFILNNPGDRYAQAAVWNAYLEQLPKEMLQEEKDEIRDDLTKRRLCTFPRQLLRRFCSKVEAAAKAEKLFDESWWMKECLAPVATWLESPASLVRRSRPNNASDLMAQICGVRRYVVSRDKAMGYALAKRMNHPSFDGRLCPVDTPESEMVGISLQLARGAWVDKDGLIHPAEGDAVVDRLSWGTSLIPFSHNNDGARDMMGAKNLRQATPVKGREMPAVRTGVEGALARAMASLMDVGICPESRDAGRTGIAMGCDLLVAYMPWNGWNVDDAVVISESVVDRMEVVERKAFSSPVEAHWQIKDFRPQDSISCGDVIARFSKPSGSEFVIRYNDDADAKVSFIKYGDGIDHIASNGAAMKVFSYEIEKEIPLGPGDKLMARHGNKGIVGRIVPESEMPRLPDDERLPEKMRGKAIEILVNPHGVLSRMNPGQLLETHLGWLFKVGGYGEDDVRAEGRSGAIGAPEVGMLDCGKVQDLLEKTGLDRNGKIKLVLPEGGIHERTVNPVVVGYEHFVRLHHIPELKAQARGKGDGALYNSVTQQPARGRKFGGGQRLGEMEVWALCAHGADHVLEEMLGAKSDKDWSGEWRSLGDMPSGKDEKGDDKYGFTHLLYDWLRALCIGIEKNGDLVRFKFLDDGEALKAEIGGEGKRVISDEASVEVQSGVFSCSAKDKSCSWSLPGAYPLSRDSRCSGLKFGIFLQTLGYDSAGPLEDAGDGKFMVRLFRKGVSVGKLHVEPDGCKNNFATTLNLVVGPIPGNEPVGWPSDEAFKKICLRAAVQVSGKAIHDHGLDNPGNKRQIALPAGTLLEQLKRSDSKYSICKDFSLVCPKHPTKELRIGPPFDVAATCAKGGLFDPGIFSGKDDWGYIELPVEVDYPSVEGVKISVIPVLPMHYRIQRDAASLTIDRGDISHYYQTIVRHCHEYERSEGNDAARGKIQVAVKDLFAELSRRMEKKHGFLRHNGLGRRVNRSFRLVITPNPELRWNQAGVPADVLWEMFGDKVLQDEASAVPVSKHSELPVERNAGWTWKSGSIPADAYAKVKNFLDRHGDLVVLLNRQPTLHRDSMQAFHPVPLPQEAGEVLQLSPLCCAGFAADFDGDEMAGHFPVTEAAQEDARRLLPNRNVRSIATGDCLAHLDRDLVTGLELIHLKPDRYRDGIDAEFWKGGVEFDQKAEAFLADKALSPGEFGKKIFSHWCQTCPDEAAKKIGALSRVAFRACTVEGVSFGFFDLRDAEIQEDGGEWHVTDGDPSLEVMVNSGANGAKQIGQVVKARGRLESVEEEIKESLVGGMPWKIYFAASQNARSSMCQKKLGTQKAGTLTRQLVLGLWDWTIAEEDCGCGDGSRSLLTCKCKKRHGICAKCFGVLPNGEKPWIGMPIGLVAAQSLGERGTQLSMRVFQTGANEIDFPLVSGLMTGSRDIGEFACQNVKDADSRADLFVGKLKRGAYAKIDARYFQLLWKALRQSPNGKLSLAAKDDFFACLARGGGQIDLIGKCAKDGKAAGLDSPCAKVFFNLFGSRAGNGGAV